MLVFFLKNVFRYLASYFLIPLSYPIDGWIKGSLLSLTPLSLAENLLFVSTPAPFKAARSENDDVGLFGLTLITGELDEIVFVVTKISREPKYRCS